MSSAEVEARTLLTRTELGRRLGVNRQRVAAYVAAGLPVAEGNRIDLATAEAWVAANVAHERRNGWKGRTNGGDAHTLNGLRRERELVRVERERHQLRTAQGDVVNREDVRRFLAARAKLERDAWVAWASRAAAAIASDTGADVGPLFAALEREVREHLRHLADTPLPEVTR